MKQLFDSALLARRVAKRIYKRRDVLFFFFFFLATMANTRIMV